VGPWVRLLALFAAIVVIALFLKSLHPLLVLALLVGGIVCANHVLTVKPKRDRSRATAELLGLRPVPEEQARIAAQPFALLGRPQARARNVMAGPWMGTQVQLFDLETSSSIQVPGLDGVRRSTCVLAPLPLETPHLVVEPRAFLTPEADRPALPVWAIESDRIAAAFDVRCEDPTFATSFLSGAVAEWLLEQEERLALETRASAVLLYGPPVPAKDRDLLLEALRGFLDAVAARGSSVEP
jgi:hypothetical protein